MRGSIVALIVTLPLLGGCGPSLRSLHRSTAWFERCYAADFDARIRSTEKHACWVAWLDHYATDQSPERITYARSRVQELGDGRSTIALPGVGAAVGPTYATDTAAPAQTDGNVPPGAPPGPDAATVSSNPPLPPASGNAACAPVCDPRWTACVSDCDHLRPRPCLDACMIEFRACARGCF